MHHPSGNLDAGNQAVLFDHPKMSIRSIHSFLLDIWGLYAARRHGSVITGDRPVRIQVLFPSEIFASRPDYCLFSLKWTFWDNA
jgi:hypothetical protein